MNRSTEELGSDDESAPDSAGPSASPAVTEAPSSAEAGNPASADRAEAMPEPAPERSYRLLVAYDGGRYHGWQFQPDLATVQGELERALKRVVGQSIRIDGAGRTDAGVHGLGQVASFRCATHVPVERLRPALNHYLPPDVRVRRAEVAPEGFHARFQAVWRRYRYLLSREESPFLRGRAYVPRGWPALEPMQQALSPLLGEHDFRGFTTQPEEPFGCCLLEARWERWEGGYAFVVRSNRFLYQMVRILVGSCLEVGRGRRGVDALGRILEGRDRRAAGPLAPAHGLYLTDVGYDPPWPRDLDSSRDSRGGPNRESFGEADPPADTPPAPLLPPLSAP